MRFVDKGWGNLLKRVQALAEAKVDVGVLGPEAKKIHPHRAGSRWRVTIAEAATINEFGSGASAQTYVPARSPMRRTFTASNPAVQDMGARAARMLIEAAGTSAQVLGLMGRLGVDALRTTLAGQNPPGNAPRTIANKGFDHPLLWTGMLWEAISHRLSKGAGEGEGKNDIIEIGGGE